MDLSFSPRAQPILSSTSLFPLPTSLRREFSGCGTQLSLPGLLRSRRRCRRTETLAPSPRCATQDVIFENSAATVAAVVAAMAALQIYLNYARRLREDTECSDQAIPNFLTGVEHFNQDTEITEQETFQVCTSESFYTDPFLFERSKTVEGVDNDVCSEKVNSSSTIYDDSRPQHGYFDSGADKLIARSPRTDVLSSSAKVIPTIGVVMKDCVASEMPDFLLGEFDESEMLLGRTSSFFSIPVKKKREMNKRTGQEHITSEGGDFLVSGYGRLLEVSCYSKEKLPDLSSISCFGSISSEPLLLTQHDKIGSYALRPDLNVPEAGPLLTSEYLEGRGPISCFKEYPGNKERGSVEVHYSAHLVSSLLHKDSNRKFSRPSQPNGNFVKDESDPATSLRTYYCSLKDGRLKDCVDVLESLERKGLLDMEKVHHARFLTACRSQKAVMEAFQFCRLIKTPTLSTFNMLLSICASSRDFDGAFQVMVLVKEAGLRPDYKLYTTLISTCGKCGKVDAMFEVFHEMVNAGVEPNVNTYGALIDGCARAGQVAKAFGAYGIMRSKNVQPDRVVFNALITACGQSGAVDRAFDVLAEMMAEPQPLTPDHVTVGALLKTCSQAGQVDRVREVYRMLQLYNIKGTPSVYTIAVRSCCETNDLEFALVIYEDMKRNGVVPDEMFLSTLIDVAGHAGNVQTAFDIMEDAKNKGMRLGNVSYSSLMGACCNGKSWQKALELYEDIKSIKLLPTVSMLNALITSLCDGDQLLKSVEVLYEMREAGVLPNEVTYSILIVACEKKGEAELGLELLSNAKSNGILPNPIMSRCLTGLCLQSFWKAYSLGEPIVSFDSGRPQIDNKWTSCAIMVYRQTIAAGVIPSIEVFSQVLGCLQFPRDSTLRDEFIENLGISFDSLRYRNICSLLDGFGEYDTRCFSILEEAASLGVVPRPSIKDNPIVVDARKLNIHTIEVYLLTILKGLKHRLAAGARLPNISIILPVERTVVNSFKGEKTINLIRREGRAVCSMLRRLGLFYQGDESFGRIRINGLTIRRWFKPKLSSSIPAGKPTEMIPVSTRLSKGIEDQQRSIRSNDLSIE